MSNYGLPPFLLGRNVSIQITPQNYATDGTFSTASIGTITFNGRLDQDDQELSYTTENISPRDSFQSNPVPYEVSSTFTITEIAQAWPLWTNSAAVYGQGNTLETAARASIYHLINIAATDNGGSTIMSWSAYVLYHDQKRTSPKSKGTFTGTFSTIIVVDESTGNFLSNPLVGP